MNPESCEKTTCPTLVPLRLNQTNTAGSLMNTGTVAVLDSDYQGSEKPAVIVVQEWWGLNEEHIKKAQKIAESGKLRVLVPDLYKGKIGVEAEEANHLMSELDFPTAIQEICTAAQWLKHTGAPAVGVTGFCMGGALALCALQACDEIVAGAPFYGYWSTVPVIVGLALTLVVHDVLALRCKQCAQVHAARSPDERTVVSV